MTAVIGTPLAIESRAVPGAVRFGPGRRASLPAGDAFLVAGVAGGLDPSVRPGDVVVAPDPSAPLLAGALRRLGLAVHIGPIHTSDRVVTGAARGRLDGFLAVDMETDRLRAAAGNRPFAAVRVVTDTAGAGLWSPGLLTRGVRALSTLRTAAPALHRWAAATGSREIVLAEPGAGPIRADLILVVDPAGSLPPGEVAAADGTEAHVVADAGAIDLGWLPDARTIAVTAGPSASPHLIDDVVRALAGLGPVSLHDLRTGTRNDPITSPDSMSSSSIPPWEVS